MTPQSLETLGGLTSASLRRVRGLELPCRDSPLGFGVCFIHQLVHLFSLFSPQGHLE